MIWRWRLRLRAAFIVGALLALGALAQEHAPSQHAPPPDNATPNEKCRSTCHVRHCDEWRACNELPESPDRSACQQRTEDNEQRCMKFCDVG